MSSGEARLSSSLARRLVEQCPDAIIFADAAGTIRVWNRAAVRIFGFSAERAIGESLDLVVPERFREAHWRGFERALAAGETRYAGQTLPTRSVHEDGSRIYVELSFAIVVDERSEVLGALAHARDITERFERERDRGSG